MRRYLLLFSMLVLAVSAWIPSGATAAPTDVTVRIEGKAGTIFDRVVRTDGGVIRSAGDTLDRTCDGTNLSANPEPGPTPTAASVDAMKITGQDFDGSWYDSYEDYFITRWGPDAEDNENGWWWGVLVNREFTPVGGCQFALNEGDEVLWVYDAFNGRPMLALGGPATAVVGEPVSVDVTTFEGNPYEGASILGLTAAAVPYLPGIVTAAPTGSDGRTSVSFSQPGWKRLKATDPGEGAIATAVPSNAIDICVERTAGSGCTGEAPSQIPARVGTPPAVEIEEPDPTCATNPSLCPDPDPDPTCETDPALCPAPAKPGLKVNGINKPRRLATGRSAAVSVRVGNPGDAVARSVRICPKTWGRLAHSGCVKVGAIAAGQIRTARFKVRARKRVKPGRAMLRVTVTSRDVPKRVRNLRLRVVRTR